MAKSKSNITLSKIILTIICALLSLFLLFYGYWKTMVISYPSNYDLQSLSYVETTIIHSEYVHLNTSKSPYLFVLEDGTNLFIPSRIVVKHFDYESFEITSHDRVCIYYDTNRIKSFEYNGHVIEAYRAISIIENEIVWVSKADNEKVNSSDYRWSEFIGWLSMVVLIMFMCILLLWLRPTTQNHANKPKNKNK